MTRRQHLFIAASSLCAIVLNLPAREAAAQTADRAPAETGMTFSGSLRTRAYAWNWFGDDPGGDYFYPAAIGRVALRHSKTKLDWQVELAFPVVLHLPGDAVLPVPKGQLGLGASYFAANGNSTDNASLFLKQAYVRLKRQGAGGAHALTIGRLEFTDGVEAMPSDSTLAALKRDRIGQRLIGTFGFTDVGRSVDGAEYTFAAKRTNLTLLGGRPTQGVFDVSGWPELSVNVFYGALTHQAGTERAPAEWRIFGLGYDDYRHLTDKADNRPAAARTADTGSIAIATIGGHYVQVVDTSGGPIDFLLWSAVQTGAWGALAHRAGAFASEVGWQPRAAERLGLWIRGGYQYGSGDASPTDERHGTFFQVLPTPRLYARLPFFNMMNDGDAFAEVIVKPAPRVIVRSDVHSLALADAHDLWYTGGGAFQAATFGYAGRPANGATALATLSDAGVDWSVNAHLAVAGYYGYAHGGPVPEAIYSTHNAAHLGYAEMLVRF
ncbi:MAG TPA: alginate export family protein [Vicinamibacterales bacterium]|nr:alginate export family protein [Vicinamibacterales bacterium]